MVQIKIKGINEAYHIYAQYDDASAFVSIWAWSWHRRATGFV